MAASGSPGYGLEQIDGPWNPVAPVTVHISMLSPVNRSQGAPCCMPTPRGSFKGTK